MRLRRGEFELDGGGVGFSALDRSTFGLAIALYQDFLFSRNRVAHARLFWIVGV